MNMVHRLVRIGLWALPLLVAVADLLALVPWILGIPGDPDAAYAEGWWLGLLSLLAYPTLFGLALVLWIIGRLLNMPALMSFAPGLAWLALLGLVAMQGWAWASMLSA